MMRQKKNKFKRQEHFTLLKNACPVASAYWGEAYWGFDIYPVGY